jgi:hypothetical protein
MRFELVEVVPGITWSVPYLQCWRCGDDVLGTELSDRDLCPRCEALAADGFIRIWGTTDED